MPSEINPTLDCKDIQEQMDVLRKLKSEFDLAHNQKDFVKAQSLKKRLEQAFLEIKKPLLHHVIEQEELLDVPAFGENIAHTMEEVNDNTLVYIGPLVDNLFQLIPDHCTHFFTEYPAREIKRTHLTFGGYTQEDMLDQFFSRECKVTLTDSAQYCMEKFVFKAGLYKDYPTCKVLKDEEGITLIEISVEDLGFKAGNDTHTQLIFKRAKELGLSLVPREVAMYYCMQGYHIRKPIIPRIVFGMEPIVDRHGDPSIFDVLYNKKSFSDLYELHASAFNSSNPEGVFVFCIKKP